jgi:hypothetical protein
MTLSHAGSFDEKNKPKGKHETASEEPGDGRFRSGPD